MKESAKGRFFENWIFGKKYDDVILGLGKEVNLENGLSKIGWVCYQHNYPN